MKISPVYGRVALGVAASALFANSAIAQRQMSSTLDEVIVTAQKREESIQDIPVSVTALDSGAIEKTYARDLLDVTGAAPNLIIDPVLGNGTAAISIRGMQLNDVEKSFDPAVAVYMDGIYLATTTGALLQIWDAEAVEVLRGPQGTLFGRNTIGGLVHVRRKQPTGEFGGRVTGTFGDFDRVDLNATINSPSIANDTLKFKGTLIYQDGGGYFDNTSRGVDEGDTDFLGLTGMVLWEPNDEFSAWLTYDHFDDETPTRPVSSLTQAGEVFDEFCNPATGVLCGNVPSNAEAHRTPTTTLDAQAHVKTDALTLNMEWQLDDKHALFGVFGWRDTDEDAIQEFDGLGAAAPAFPANGDFFWTERPQTLEQTSLEVRWHADWADGAIKTVAGLYFLDSKYTLDQITNSLIFFGVPVNPGDIVTTRPQFVQETETFAVFGQLDWDINDNWQLSVGARFTDEEKEACGNQRVELLDIGIVPVRSYGATSLALCNSDDPFYEANGTNPITGAQVPRTGVESWDAVTPRVALTYRFNQGIVYGAYTEGFRSGGFNGRAATAFSLGPYDPEDVQTFEIGAKTQWADDRVQLNATFFTTDYEDKQEDVVFPDPVAITETVVQNASGASIDGVELELIAVPTEGLTLTASAGFLDAGYDNYLIPDPFQSTPTNFVFIDQSGFDLRRAPERTFALNGLYERPLANGAFLVFSANYLWRDDYWIIARTNNTQPGTPGFNPSYGLLDASISYETERWRLSLFGKNLTEDDYFLHTLDVAANVLAASPTDSSPVYLPGLWTFGTINAPRTWGVEVDFKF